MIPGPKSIFGSFHQFIIMISMVSSSSFIKKSQSKRTHWVLFSVFLIMIICLLIFNLEFSVDTSSLSSVTQHTGNGNRVCKDDDSSISVYLLKTKLGVTYQGSHWVSYLICFRPTNSLVSLFNRFVYNLLLVIVT
jgi:hypothetical protein